MYKLKLIKVAYCNSFAPQFLSTDILSTPVFLFNVQILLFFLFCPFNYLFSLHLHIPAREVARVRLDRPADVIWKWQSILSLSSSP